MKVKVLVQVWTEIDPTLNVRIDPKTASVAAEEGDQLTRVSPAARSGLNIALGIAEAEVIAFAIGPGHDQALRHGLALGSARAVRLREREGLPESFAASAIAGWIEREQPHLVLADRKAAAIAFRLGWAHLAGIERLESGSGRLLAWRLAGRGALERVSATVPAVIRLQTEAPRFRYLARARLAAAQARPIEEVILDGGGRESNLPAAGPLQMARPRTRIGAAFQAPAASKASDRLGALMGIASSPASPLQAKPPPSSDSPKTPGELADEFVRYLAHNQLLR